MSNKTNTHNTKTAQRKQEEAISYKVLSVFTIAILAMFYLLIIRAYVTAGGPTTIAFLWIVSAVGILVLAFGIISAAGVVKAISSIWSQILIIGGFAAAFCSLMMLFVGDSLINPLCFLFPILAILYLILNIYQCEFFLISLETILAACMLWAIHKTESITPFIIVITAITALVIVSCVLVSAVGSKNAGELKLGKKQLHMFAPKAIYLPLYLTSAAAVVSVVLSLLLGSAAAYILMFVMIAALFINAVFYTVKLM